MYFIVARNSKIAGMLFFPVLFVSFFVILILILIVIKIPKIIKKNRILSAIKDPDEKIQKIEELNNKGFYKNSLGEYLNNLSVAYYEKDDIEKALELIREAIQESNRAENNTKTIIIGKSVTATDIYRMNEVLYLILLGQIDEAEQLDNLIDESRLKHPIALNLLWNRRAQLAVCNGDALIARELLKKARDLPLKIPKGESDNNFYYSLLIEAECDLLEHNKETALSKLNEIAAQSTFAPTVKRAKEIIAEIR
jgi:tetratricopeptide (TPR) repeat protein